VIATASTVAAALVLLPLALLQLPDEVPSLKALGSVAALGIAGTAIALLFFYRMLGRYGASRASLVTYLLPVIALVLGALLLDEPVELTALIGLVLILAGVAFGSGMVKPERRREVAPASSAP
jgi:drug/metabolite transporter (DMT)-like permease